MASSRGRNTRTAIAGFAFFEMNGDEGFKAFENPSFLLANFGNFVLLPLQKIP
jgi:hypothetical protein